MQKKYSNKSSNTDKKNICVIRKKALQLIALIMSLLALLAVCIAWFTFNKNLNLNGLLASTQQDDNQVKLFKLIEGTDGTITINATKYKWQEINNIDFSLSVPNQTARYKFVYSGDKSLIKVNITNQVLPSGVNAPGFFKFLYLKMVKETDGFTDWTKLTGADKSFYDNGTIVNNVFKSAEYPGTVITEGTVKSIIFDVYMHKDVCNYYESWKFDGDMRVV